MVDTAALLSTMGVGDINLRMEIFQTILSHIPGNMTLPPYGVPLLHFLIENGQEELGQIYASKADLSLEFQEERALSRAIRHGLFTLAEYIISVSDINFRDVNEDTVLHEWIKSGGLTMPTNLLPFSNSQNILGVTPIMYAVLVNNHSMLDILLDLSDLNLVTNEKMNILHLSAVKNDLKAVTKIAPRIETNQVNIFNNTPLMEAVLADDQTEIDLAKILDVFISLSPKIPAITNVYGKNLAHLLAIRNFSTVLKTLANQLGDQMHQKDKEGLKPLHNAILHGSVEGMKVLLEYETDFQYCTEKYGTIFHMCAHQNPQIEFQLVKALIADIKRRKINLNDLLSIPSSKGQFPLNLYSRQTVLILNNALNSQ